MTGFARVRKTAAQGEIVFTLKTVNHRGLDMQFQLPPEMEALESAIRAVVRNGVLRGHVQVRVSFTRTAAVGGAVPNRALLDAYMRAFREAAGLYGIEGAPDLNAALSIPGMLSAGAADEGADEETGKAILEAAAEAVRELNRFREREGAATAGEIRQRGRNVCALVSRMEEIRSGAVDAFQTRLRERLADLLQGAGLDPQRLAQEAAVAADRSDISEELLRLRTHAAQVEALLAGEGEAGKRLDFLLQEMNREANTVLSKTGGLGDLGLTMTDLALAAKSEIDKIREQVLNLE
ncbi:MAG: YicC family protein [Acidobacteriia bacterium]|nr:YicC family protein [Terriglobia bacterium]